MASTKRLLIDNIMAEVRRMAGELNDSGNISDDFLLDALNRAIEESAMLLGRYYPEPLLTYDTDTTVAGQAEYDIPEDCLEGRIQRVELIPSAGAAPQELLRIQPNDNTKFESASGTTGYPQAWFEVGFTRKLRILPQPIGGLTLRIWYVRELPQVAVSQGKITNKNYLYDLTAGKHYVILDELGDELTSTLDEDGSHVSVVDGQTGLIKATYEISSVVAATKKVTFATSPTVTVVDNVPVTAPASTDGVAVGDFLAVAPKTCICQIRSPFTNYMIQYAFALIQQVNGADAQIAYAALNRLEKFVKSMDKGTPSRLRIENRSHAFGAGMNSNPVTIKGGGYGI